MTRSRGLIQLIAGAAALAGTGAASAQSVYQLRLHEPNGEAIAGRAATLLQQSLSGRLRQTLAQPIEDLAEVPGSAPRSSIVVTPIRDPVSPDWARLHRDGVLVTISGGVVPPTRDEGLSLQLQHALVPCAIWPVPCTQPLRSLTLHVPTLPVPQPAVGPPAPDPQLPGRKDLEAYGAAVRAYAAVSLGLRAVEDNVSSTSRASPPEEQRRSLERAGLLLCYGIANLHTKSDSQGRKIQDPVIRTIDDRFAEVLAQLPGAFEQGAKLLNLALAEMKNPRLSTLCPGHGPAR